MTQQLRLPNSTVEHTTTQKYEPENLDNYNYFLRYKRQRWWEFDVLYKGFYENHIFPLHGCQGDKLYKLALRMLRYDPKLRDGTEEILKSLGGDTGEQEVQELRCPSARRIIPRGPSLVEIEDGILKEELEFLALGLSDEGYQVSSPYMRPAAPGEERGRNLSNPPAPLSPRLPRTTSSGSAHQEVVFDEYI